MTLKYQASRKFHDKNFLTKYLTTKICSHTVYKHGALLLVDQKLTILSKNCLLLKFFPQQHFSTDIILTNWELCTHLTRCLYFWKSDSSSTLREPCVMKLMHNEKNNWHSLRLKYFSSKNLLRKNTEKFLTVRRITLQCISICNHKYLKYVYIIFI